MTNYDLLRLGNEKFEELVQSLLRKVIGNGTITFGKGPDGGREATFTGPAPYPSLLQVWSGNWIFQAKFHDTTRIGPEKARKDVVKDLDKELDKITNKYKRDCQNYILATNVPLSSTPETGTHDRIHNSVIPKYSSKIKNIVTWGYDDICNFLDNNEDVRHSHLHLITPGDVFAELADQSKQSKSRIAEAVEMYVTISYEREKYAQLEQAGEVNDNSIKLKQVFIDLDVELRTAEDIEAIPDVLQNDDDVSLRIQLLEEGKVSATDVLLSHNVKKVMLIGGPGQGKSTLGQFVAQIHRAHIANKQEDLGIYAERYTPKIARLPFRVILRDFAQWIVDDPSPHSVEKFLALIIKERSDRELSSEDIQNILKKNPCLVIFDGIDEITEPELLKKVIQLINEFIIKCENILKADLQIIATSRPTGYQNQFDSSDFLHLRLSSLTPEKISEYTELWIGARDLETQKAQSLKAAIEDCIEDPHFSSLMNTPLQVTIFILIVLHGGTPPRQKEELFNEYLEVIYKREKSKSKTIIETDKRLLFGLHEYMGYILHKKAAESSDVRSRLKEEEFREEVMRYLAHNDPYSKGEKLKTDAEKMISEARQRLVLLVELEPGFFGFELRSIQEFFGSGISRQSKRQLSEIPTL
ncbi:NACHT domain-containing protein [Candidatus Nitrososphaera sp. FF02]|uniref:NACHT domain-containing protein n=1 Tax=Candidatus Nitrososphaera sp. FF02 TaxID=3398226 RepID=UPI0039EC2F21